jgi:hypothetical protein
MNPGTCSVHHDEIPDIQGTPYPLPQCVPSTPAHLSALVQNMRDWGSKSVTTVPLPHMLHDIHNGWLKSRPTSSPNMSLSIKLHLPSYKQIGLPAPQFSRKITNPTRSAKTPSTMDTGAQMNVGPVSLLTDLGIKPDTILPLQSRIEGASSEPISLLGGIVVEVSGTTATGKCISTLQLLYISKSVKHLYMSLDACIALQVVPEQFPLLGSCSPETGVSAAISAQDTPYTPQKCTNTGVLQPGTPPCSCPTRCLPPTDKPVLPCAATTENLPILKRYILERFAPSAFNTCQRQTLPLMKGSPPLNIHMLTSMPGQ